MNKTKSEILTKLIVARRPLSTKQLAVCSKVSWKTARDNLEKLFKLALVCRGRVGNNKRIYWKNA